MESSKEYLQVYRLMFLDVLGGGLGMKYFDILEIPVGGFVDNYKKYLSGEMGHFAAWMKAMLLQFEKRLDD